MASSPSTPCWRGVGVIAPRRLLYGAKQPPYVSLTSLDFLNLGVPSPTPSLGELPRQAKGNVEAWWLSLATFAVLVLINFIGEALLQAFDSRRRGGPG